MVIQPFFLSFFFLKDPVDCLVWESSQFPECSCLLTEDPRSEPPSQDQCLCQRACKHLHTVHPTSSAQRGFGNPSNAEEEVYSLKKKKKKYCLHLFVYILSVPQPPSPSPYLQVQLNLRKHFKRIKWYNWEIFGGSLANLNWPLQSSQPLANMQCPRCHGERLLNVRLFSWSQTVCFFVPFFPVFWLEQIGHLTMTSLCMTMGQRGNVSWQNE